MIERAKAVDVPGMMKELSTLCQENSIVLVFRYATNDH